MTEDSSTPATDAVAAQTSKPTLYRIYVDAPTVGRVEDWAEKGEAGGGIHGFTRDEGPFVPMGDADLAYLGTARGHTREAVVDWILDVKTSTPAPSPTDDPDRQVDVDRVQLIQDAEQAGIDLMFRVAPAGYVGEVPVATKVERTRKVGK